MLNDRENILNALREKPLKIEIRYSQRAMAHWMIRQIAPTVLSPQEATIIKVKLRKPVIAGSGRSHPAFAFSPAASMPATAQVSSLSEVSPLTPTAPSRVAPSWISTPPGTGTSRPCAREFTAPTK